MIRRTNGFTLVEILITILIISILAFIIGFTLNIVKKNGADSRRITDIQQIAKALELYYDQEAKYPGTLSELVTNRYLTNIPMPSPGTGQVFYTYVPLGANQICPGYHLGAVL